MKVLLEQWKETGVMPEQWRKSKKMRQYITKKYPKSHPDMLKKLDHLGD